MVEIAITIHPERRRQGHGSVVLAEAVRRVAELGRDIIWVGAAEDDPGARRFLEQHGFGYASHDARRRQALAEVDPATVERLFASALGRSADYQLERHRPPFTEALLGELVEVTAAINDAPMGELTFEDEKFDVHRLDDQQLAAAGRGDRIYRVLARHRHTGEVGGHTMMVVNPFFPQWAGQGDTAVARPHRGHRLGLLVKIEMMRWLAEAEPQVSEVETWNHADNAFMIGVNELLGYRLSRVFAMYERRLTRLENAVATGRGRMTPIAG